MWFSTNLMTTNYSTKTKWQVCIYLGENQLNRKRGKQCWTHPRWDLSEVLVGLGHDFHAQDQNWLNICRIIIIKPDQPAQTLWQQMKKTQNTPEPSSLRARLLRSPFIPTQLPVSFPSVLALWAASDIFVSLWRKSPQNGLKPPSHSDRLPARRSPLIPPATGSSFDVFEKTLLWSFEPYYCYLSGLCLCICYCAFWMGMLLLCGAWFAGVRVG